MVKFMPYLCKAISTTPGRVQVIFKEFLHKEKFVVTEKSAYKKFLELAYDFFLNEFVVIPMYMSQLNSLYTEDYELKAFYSLMVSLSKKSIDIF